MNDLKKSVFELRIYFDKNDHKYFEQVMNNFLAINGTIMNQYFNYERYVDINQKVNSYYKAKDKTLIDNSTVVDKIAQIIRKTFDHK